MTVWVAVAVALGVAPVGVAEGVAVTLGVAVGQGVDIAGALRPNTNTDASLAPLTTPLMFWVGPAGPQVGK